jgi:hypothetical protein
MRKKPSHKF